MAADQHSMLSRDPDVVPLSNSKGYVSISLGKFSVYGVKSQGLPK